MAYNLENSTTGETTDEPVECRSYGGFALALFIYSVFVIFLYALLQRRTNKYKKICHGYFGIPIPVNLIHETKDRWVYAAAFGSLTGELLTIIIEGSALTPITISNEYVNNIFKGVFLMLTTMIYPLAFFSLFASIHGAVQILTHIIGFVYVLLLFIQLILSCNSCDNAAKENTEEGIIQNVLLANLYGKCIPIGICLGLVGGYFVYRGIQSVLLLILRRPLPKQQHDVTHHLGYVRRLFKKPSTSPPPSNKILATIQPYLYQWDPYFKYSVRVLSAGVVVFMVLIVLTFEQVNLLVIVSNLIEVAYEGSSFEEENQDLVNAVVGLAYFFSIFFPLVSLSIVMISFLTSLAAYRRQCKLIWKGDQYYLPKKKKPLAKLLVSSIKYFGFQIAMSLWAWLLYTILFILIIFIFIGFIVAMVLLSFVREWVLRQFIFLISSTAVGFAIYYAQYFAAKYLFVSKDGALIDNRRLYHVFTFFFLFYYMLVGLFKAIARIFISAVLNLFYLPRLDTALTLKGWEWLDKAYVSYMSVVSVDATHNNPVLNVFIYLLCWEIQPKAQSTLIQEQPSHNTVQFNVLATFRKLTSTEYYTDASPLRAPLVQEFKEDTNRAKKWWFLAYTLIHNPSLIELRKKSGKDNLLDPDVSQSDLV